MQSDLEEGELMEDGEIIDLQSAKRTNSLGSGCSPWNSSSSCDSILVENSPRLNASRSNVSERFLSGSQCERSASLVNNARPNSLRSPVAAVSIRTRPSSPFLSFRKSSLHGDADSSDESSPIHVSPPPSPLSFQRRSGGSVSSDHTVASRSVVRNGEVGSHFYRYQTGDQRFTSPSHNDTKAIERSSPPSCSKAIQNSLFLDPRLFTTKELAVLPETELVLRQRELEGEILRLKDLLLAVQHERQRRRLLESIEVTEGNSACRSSRNVLTSLLQTPTPPFEDLRDDDAASLNDNEATHIRLTQTRPSLIFCANHLWAKELSLMVDARRNNQVPLDFQRDTDFCGFHEKSSDERHCENSGDKCLESSASSPCSSVTSRGDERQEFEKVKDASDPHSEEVLSPLNQGGCKRVDVIVSNSKVNDLRENLGDDTVGPLSSLRSSTSDPLAQDREEFFRADCIASIKKELHDTVSHESNKTCTKVESLPASSTRRSRISVDELSAGKAMCDRPPPPPPGRPHKLYTLDVINGFVHEVVELVDLRGGPVLTPSGLERPEQASYTFTRDKETGGLVLVENITHLFSFFPNLSYCKAEDDNICNNGRAITGGSPEVIQRNKAVEI